MKKEKITYLDSSVILRHAVGDKKAFKEMDAYTSKYAISSLTRVECSRVLERWRISREISDTRLLRAWQIVREFLNAAHIVSLDDAIVTRACGSFPIALKSLDAIHLATALGVRDDLGFQVTVLTHDAKLGAACNAVDLPTAGVEIY